MTDISVKKLLFRKNILKTYSDAGNYVSGLTISNFLIPLLSQLSVKSLGIFFPIPPELDYLSDFFSIAIQSFKIASPVCQKDKLIFRTITSMNDMEKSTYGLLEPKSHCPTISSDKLNAILVPGLAFDRRGYRLGRGKGYYDRFLSTYKGISIGVCYSFQLFDEIPIEPHDEKVDIIMTEKETVINDKFLISNFKSISKSK